MSIRMAAFGACVALAAGFSFADEKADNEKLLKAMAGPWTFESHVMAGEKAPAELAKSLVITFDGEKFTVKMGDTVAQAGTHTISTAKKPHTVDAVVTEGEGKGTTMKGIFEVDGDTMKVCFDTSGKTRPEKYESPAKSAMANMVLKRKK
jgi:uncharacterized protein (TIGR03067 family)